ncbi:unnamed protein product [Notodromas monacha]|uniref:All-trans-retinol 13,14-reductase n=1 Tax=Notodromas monacha TaxID=399045 RepID=A0A7R9GEH2_9CRUS|nr:unnamed protein product [Notodromas monacha]CAG0918066.1 unnamed protein product [Notodromas monacha]
MIVEKFLTAFVSETPFSSGSGVAMLTGVLAVLIGVLGFRYLVKKYFGKDASRTPIFSEKNLSKPFAGVETDEKIRNAVLKQGFSIEKVPSDLDAIFIGSGIGSLSAACFLAKAGKKVLVLEQHDRAGGCCHTFTEKGFEFDTGIHYVGNEGPGQPDRILMDQLTGGRLHWDKLDDVYDVVKLGTGKDQKTFEIKSGSRQIWENALIEKFPDEADAIRKFTAAYKPIHTSFFYVGMVKFLPYWLMKVVISLGIIDWVTDYNKWNNICVRDFINGLTTNKDLRLVLQYLFGDYGTLPDKASIPILSLIHGHYWKNGAFYPRGGASEIPFHVIQEIQKADGAVLVRAKVQSILLDAAEKKAIGVRVEKGSKTYDIHAPKIISGAGFRNTFEKLLPKPVSMRLNRVQEVKTKVTPSASAFQAFFGFNGSQEELKLPKHNTWFYSTNEDPAITMKSYLNMTREEALSADPPFVFIAFPSTKDSTYVERHPNKICCTVVSVSNYDWFQEWSSSQATKRGDEYESVKNTMGQRLLDMVLDLFPQLQV